MLQAVRSRSKLDNAKQIYFLIKKSNSNNVDSSNIANLNLENTKTSSNLDDSKKENFINLANMLDKYRVGLKEMKLVDKLTEKIDLFSKSNSKNPSLYKLITNIKNSDEYQNTFGYFKANLDHLNVKEQACLMRVLSILELDPKSNDLVIELEKKYYYQIENCDLYDMINFFKAFYRLRFNGNNLFDLMHFYKESTTKFQSVLAATMSNLSSNNNENKSYLDDLFKDIGPTNDLRAVLIGPLLFYPIIQSNEYYKIYECLMDRLDTIYNSSYENVALFDFLLSFESTSKKLNILYQGKAQRMYADNHRMLSKYFNSELNNNILNASLLKFSEKSFGKIALGSKEKIVEIFLKEEYLHNMSQLYLNVIFYLNPHNITESLRKDLNDRLNLLMKNMDSVILNSFANKPNIGRLRNCKTQLERLNLKLNNSIVQEVKDKLKSNIGNITRNIHQISNLTLLFPVLFDEDIAKNFYTNKKHHKSTYLSYSCLNEKYLLSNLKKFENVLLSYHEEVSMSNLKMFLTIFNELGVKHSSYSKEISEVKEQINDINNKRIVKRIFENTTSMQRPIVLSDISDKYPNVSFYDYFKIYILNENLNLNNETFNCIKRMGLDSVEDDLNMEFYTMNTKNYFEIYSFIKANESNLETVRNLNIDLLNYMYSIKYHVRHLDYIVKVLKMFNYYRDDYLTQLLYSINKLLVILCDDAIMSHVFHDQSEFWALRKNVVSKIEFVEECCQMDVKKNSELIKEFENLFSVVYPLIRNDFDVDLTKLNYHLISLGVFNEFALSDLIANTNKDMNKVETKQDFYPNIQEKMLLAYIVRKIKLHGPEIQVLQQFKFNSIEKYNSYCECLFMECFFLFSFK